MTDIQEHMLRMFINLRKGVGLAGLSLPLILVTVGYFGYKVPFAGSMSAYYHATAACVDPASASADAAACAVSGAGPMRNWFVANLFFIGAAMLLMRGFSRFEDAALNIAGVAAPCIALFPMTWGPHLSFNPHLTFAVAFF